MSIRSTILFWWWILPLPVSYIPVPTGIHFQDFSSSRYSEFNLRKSSYFNVKLYVLLEAIHASAFLFILQYVWPLERQTPIALRALDKSVPLFWWIWYEHFLLGITIYRCNVSLGISTFSIGYLLDNFHFQLLIVYTLSLKRFTATACIHVSHFIRSSDLLCVKSGRKAIKVLICCLITPRNNNTNLIYSPNYDLSSK